ncbi:DUF6017 domain-containing protein [uncultured Ruminococcus sp.]|uniref:DUF6017 domain-containing protein n=1 Tax=uncultured Ruminococcus sp. TaxID=165186 RepID=UPI00266C9BDD|nr:DUF6017 domain-containing protein [uncultured Ruminococcus sp.]
MDKRNRKKKTVNDTVCEIHKFSGYAVLSNCFVRSTNLGCPAIGLLGRVMDLPPEWNFSKAGLIAICPDGETAIDSALNDLKEWGYLEVMVKMPNENPTGRIQTVYKFYEYSAKDTSIPQYDYELETFTVDNAVLNRVNKKVGNFTMVSNKLLRNKELPNKLLGFLLKVLSLPDYWHFSMSGLKAICKEGRTAVHNAVNKLIDMGYLVRTQLLSNESIHNCFEYVYSFFDVPVSKEQADELEAETRRKAITIRAGGRAEKPVSSEGEKQKVENPYPDIPSAETPLSENHGQYNTKEKIKNNSLLSDKSSIIPSAAIPQVFNGGNVEKSNEGYNAEEVEYYTEVVKENIGYGYLGDWLTEDGRDGYAEADNIVGFIVDEICSPLPYTTLRGTKFPRSVIKSKMLQANIYMVESVLVKMAQVDGIKDFRRYFISSLYNEVLTYHFNEGCESRWASYAVARDFGYAV